MTTCIGSKALENNMDKNMEKQIERAFVKIKNRFIGEKEPFSRVS